MCDAKRATLWCTYNLEGTKCNYGAPGRQKGRLAIEHEIWFPKMDQPLCSHAMRSTRERQEKVCLESVPACAIPSGRLPGCQPAVVSLQSLLLEKALMTLFLHSMHGENPALHAGLEACPNSRHKSRKQEKQKTVIVLLVNICIHKCN